MTSLCVFEGEALHPVMRAIELATGRRPNKSTSFRWMDSQARIPLPYVMLGGQRMCSVESVQRWIAAVTAARSGTNSEPTSQIHDRDVAEAERNLVEGGW